MEPAKTTAMKKNRLAEKLLHRKTKFPLAEMMPKVEQWFDSPAGKELLAQQKIITDEVLSTLFGYHLMQISACRDISLCESSKIRHRFSIGPLEGDNIVGIADEEQLPIESESVDVVLLHHTMEYSQHPHQLLKEASRVVLPSGYVVIVSFNPFSFMGLWSLVGRLRPISVWKNHLLSIPRLADWLVLMDLKVQSVQYGHYKPPVCSNKFTSKFAKLEQFLTFLQLPFGSFYVLVAKKEVSTITPIKPKWRRTAKPIIPIMEPSLYTHQDNKKTIH